MPSKAVIGYLCLPAAVGVAGLLFGLQREALSAEMLVAYGIGGCFFYAAPHLLWALVAALGKFPKIVWHAGFVGASVALVTMVVLPFFGRDPSGLPLQWMVYWPLAVALIAALSIASGLYLRFRVTG